jgi:hypothetical protein
MPVTGAESWIVLGDDGAVVAPCAPIFARTHLHREK